MPHKGTSNVHLSVLISVLEMVVANTLVILKVLRSTRSSTTVQIAAAQHVTARPQLCQLAYKAHQKETHHFLYNTTKQFVK